MTIVLIIAYMWLMVHRLFEIWPAFGVVRPVLLAAVCLLIVWIFGSQEKRSLGNIFTPAIFFYTLAITLATMLSPFTNIFDNGDFHNWLKEMLFFIILMTSVKNDKDLKIVVTAYTVTVFLYMAHSYRGFMSGNVWRFDGVSRLVGLNSLYGDPNDYGTFIVFSLPFILPLLLLCKKRWHYLFVIGYILLTLRSVMGTGSRTAFLMLVTLVVLPMIVSKHRFKLVPAMLIGTMIFWSVMPVDMQNRYRTIWDDSINEQANKNRDGRLLGFYEGMENWENYPVFGVGPSMHPMALGTLLQSHNLYGQVAGETGTFGIIAFLLMLSCFGINHFNIWKNYKYLQEKNLGSEGRYCWCLSIAIMYAILMVLLQGMGLHNAYRFPWIWFGAFQALAALIIMEKVDAAVKGQLLPQLPEMTKRSKR